jgi:hypothetical protein
MVNPFADIVQISAVSGEGLGAWYAWIDAQRKSARGQALA